MLIYNSRGFTKTTKYKRDIAVGDTLINVNSEYQSFKRMISSYLRKVHNISFNNPETDAYIFLEVLYKMFNNSKLDFSSSEILDVFDYAIGVDPLVNFDGFLDFSDIIDFDIEINDLFSGMVERYSDSVMTDYVAFRETLSIVLRKRITVTEKVAVEKCIKVPLALDTLFVRNGISYDNIHNTLFISGLIDICLLLIKYSGDALDVEQKVSELIVTHKLYTKANLEVMFNYDKDGVEVILLKSIVYDFVDIFMGSKILSTLNEIVIIETVINKNIIMKVFNNS